jgi:hypothetical protein
MRPSAISICIPLRETFPFLADFVVSPNFTRYRKQINRINHLKLSGVFFIPSRTNKHSFLDDSTFTSAT